MLFEGLLDLQVHLHCCYKYKTVYNTHQGNTLKVDINALVSTNASPLALEIRVARSVLCALSGFRGPSIDSLICTLVGIARGHKIHASHHALLI